MLLDWLIYRTVADIVRPLNKMTRRLHRHSERMVRKMNRISRKVERLGVKTEWADAEMQAAMVLAQKFEALLSVDDDVSAETEVE